MVDPSDRSIPWHSASATAACQPQCMLLGRQARIHLTNDAVQKKLEDYGKFESGNKLSYQEFQKYLDSQGIKCDFAKDVTTKIR